MNPTVVVLLSDKRSGSTLFEKELCRHSAVQHIHFTPHTYNESHYWVKAACILRAVSADWGTGVRPRSYGPPAQARQSLVATIRGNVPGFQLPNDDEALIFQGWEALCHQFAHPVFFEKSPHHPHHWAALELMLKWAQQTNFQVRFIGLVRNPMAVMYSALKLFYTPPEARQFGWAHANRNILKMADLLGREQFKSVRYEDLIDNPIKGFQEICDFISIEYQEHIGQTVNADSLFKWRNDPDFDFELDEEVAAFAHELGYSEEDLFNPPKPQRGAVRRMQRKLRFGIKRAQSRAYSRIKNMSGRILHKS